MAFTGVRKSERVFPNGAGDLHLSAADNMNMVMAMSRGADDFIAKPFRYGRTGGQDPGNPPQNLFPFRKPGESVLEHKGRGSQSFPRATLTWNGEETELTRNELRILELRFFPGRETGIQRCHYDKALGK